MKTFTIGFEDRDRFHERPFARTVANRFGTEHHGDRVPPDVVELGVDDFIQHHDQPFGD